MGVLDEAIRQHLDLKRKHGADEGEIARQEQEALGPARRDTPSPDQEEDEVAAATAPGAEDEDAVEEAASEPVAYDDADAVEDEALAEPEPVAGPDEPFSDATPIDEPFADEETAALEDLPPVEDPDAPTDDVLEETPDFLQETPEHDRLWFEQKPPRDFDFDE